ncbi:hypothetical protein ACOACQ_13250 [Nocardioides sp. CPCC 206347]|uniref:hypothetical protein n=1 Tax=unclassified Nocardioides TaxID=2615069 RepID=UPI003609EF8D
MPHHRLVLLALVVPLALSACGGGADNERSADPAGVLSAEALDDALLQSGSTVGDAEVGPEDLPGLADDRVADPEACQPLSAIVDLDPEPVRSERVQAKTPRLGPWVNVQLLTYADDDAEQVFALVEDALEACAGGFAEDRVRDVAIKIVVPESVSDRGDEATAYATVSTEVDEADPVETIEHMVLVRDGQQLLSFRAASAGDDGGARALLAAVVDAQWKRYADREAPGH